MDFVCPKCRGELVFSNGVKRCSLGHSYDRARAGYFNLILGSSGGTHGDNREMVEARRRFLDGDYYLPLANRLCELVCEHATPTLAVLDCGCGEGYYTSKIDRALCERLDTPPSVLAFDISREAAKLAAKRCKRVSVAVASCYDVPVADGAVGVALNVFSPLAPSQVHRTLADGGKYIIAYPDEGHLFELKAAIYDNPYENAPSSEPPQGFTLLHREGIKYEITLDSREKIGDLFMMTPYAYRTGKKERERLEKLEKLTTRVEFLIDVYEKI